MVGATYAIYASSTQKVYLSKLFGIVACKIHYFISPLIGMNSNFHKHESKPVIIEASSLL